MRKRDRLDWRIRIANYLLQYMQTDIGEENRGRITDDLNMLVLESREIMEDREEEHELSHEGPLGPLPEDLMDALG